MKAARKSTRPGRLRRACRWLVWNGVPQALVALAIDWGVSRLARRDGHWELCHPFWAAVMGAAMGFYLALWVGTRRAVAIGVIGGASLIVANSFALQALLPIGEIPLWGYAIATFWLFELGLLTGFFKAGPGDVAEGAVRGLVAWALWGGSLIALNTKAVQALYSEILIGNSISKPLPVVRWAIPAAAFVAGIFMYVPIFWRSRLLRPTSRGRVMALRRGRFSLGTVVVLSLLITSVGWLYVNMHRHEPVAERKTRPTIYLHLSPDGSMIIGHCNYSGAGIWRTDDLEPVEMEWSPEAVATAGFMPGGTRVFSTDNSGGISIWDIATGKLVASASTGLSTSNTVVTSPDGRLIATESRSHDLLVYEAETMQAPTMLSGANVYGQGWAFSPDGKLLAAQSDGSSIILWETGSWSPVLTIETDTEQTGEVIFSPDGKKVLVTVFDEGRCVTNAYHAKTGHPVATLRGYVPGLDRDDPSTSFSPDGRLVLTAPRFPPACAFFVSELDWGRPKVIGKRFGGVMSAGFTPDGKRILDVCMSLRIWDFPGGRRTAFVRDTVWCAVATPDGERVITSNHEAICLWRLADLEKTRGIYGMRELWASLLFAVLLGLSLARDSKSLGGRAPR